MAANPQQTVKTAGAASSANQEALAAQIGEVQATPTANTLLRRLKDLLSLIVLSNGESHIGEVGGSSITVTPTHAVWRQCGACVRHRTLLLALLAFALAGLLLAILIGGMW